jgi:hypothetical protein
MNASEGLELQKETSPAITVLLARISYSCGIEIELNANLFKRERSTLGGGLG